MSIRSTVEPNGVAVLPPPLYAGYAFDLDGTIYLGDTLIDGSRELVMALRERGARVVFVTNKPLETGQDYASKLSRLGIPTVPVDVVTALDSLVLYLQRTRPGAAVLTIAESLVDIELERAGFTVTRSPEAADVVVVSFDRTFDYAKLTRAYQAVRAGAAIVATNPDPYCPTPDGGIPDCAAMLAALEACTGVRAEAVLGKPSVHMTATILERLECEASQSVMVGDRLSTDVAMGLEAGMASVLVLSGATGTAELAGSPIRPDYVLNSVTGLLS